ncbi:MAG: thioredoxin TrxC [Methylovirgula sp.]
MSSLHIVCPNCAAINRVPEDKPLRKAQCGACHEPLFQGHPVPVDAAKFDKHRRGNDIAVLVDVWAPWCGPCRTMAPQFERAAEALEPNVRLLKLNSDEEQDVARDLGVRGIPNLILFQGGRVVAQTAGAMDANSIIAWVGSNLSAPK